MLVVQYWWIEIFAKLLKVLLKDVIKKVTGRFIHSAQSLYITVLSSHNIAKQPFVVGCIVSTHACKLQLNLMKYSTNGFPRIPVRIQCVGHQVNTLQKSAASTVYAIRV